MALSAMLMTFEWRSDNGAVTYFERQFIEHHQNVEHEAPRTSR
jgi:hypothetical protein